MIGQGRTQIFTGVTSIVANGGEGNDSIVVKSGIRAPVVFHGGNGDDTLIYLGSGSASLYGDAGNDYLEVGPAATGTILLDGGTGDDYLAYNGSRNGVHLYGGDGNDNVLGGSGDDFLYGGEGNDGLESNGGNDTIDAGNGNDVIRIPMPTWTSYPTVIGGGGTDYLLVTTSTGNDVMYVFKPSDADLQIDQQVSKTNSAAVGTVKATGIEELDLLLGDGADTATIETLVGSSVATIVVDAGQNIHHTGVFQLMPDPDNPGLNVRQEIVTYSNDGDADSIVVRGLPTADSFSLNGNDKADGVRVIHAGYQDVFVRNTVRSESDSLTIDGRRQRHARRERARHVRDRRDGGPGRPRQADVRDVGHDSTDDRDREPVREGDRHDVPIEHDDRARPEEDQREGSDELRDRGLPEVFHPAPP